VTTIERGKHYQLLKSITINRERERERGRYAGCFSQHTRSTKCTKLSTIGKLSKKKNLVCPLNLFFPAGQQLNHHSGHNIGDPIPSAVKGTSS
jgi:hypothetical protein